MQKMEESWHHLNILDAIDHLNKTGHLSDVSIRVGAKGGNQQVFKCHKFVLALASPYFETMFFGLGDFKEKNQPEIEVTDAEPEDFKNFLNYVYNRRDIDNFTPFSINNLLNFIYMGQKYLLPKYSEFGVAGLEKVIPELNLADLLELFDKLCCIGQERLVSSISKNFKGKIDKNIRLHPIIFNFDLSVFNEFIGSIKGCVPEISRFNLIQEYIDRNKNAPSKEEEIIPEDWSALLETLSYEDMSIEEISNGPLKSKLLDVTEKLKVLVNKGVKLETKCAGLQEKNATTAQQPIFIKRF